MLQISHKTSVSKNAKIKDENISLKRLRYFTKKLKIYSNHVFTKHNVSVH